MSPTQASGLQPHLKASVSSQHQEPPKSMHSPPSPHQLPGQGRAGTAWALQPCGVAGLLLWGHPRWATGAGLL